MPIVAPPELVGSASSSRSTRRATRPRRRGGGGGRGRRRSGRRHRRGGGGRPLDDVVRLGRRLRARAATRCRRPRAARSVDVGLGYRSFAPRNVVRSKSRGDLASAVEVDQQLPTTRVRRILPWKLKKSASDSSMASLGRPVTLTTLAGIAVALFLAGSATAAKLKVFCELGARAQLFSSYPHRWSSTSTPPPGHASQGAAIAAGQRALGPPGRVARPATLGELEQDCDEPVTPSRTARPPGSSGATGPSGGRQPAGVAAKQIGAGCATGRAASGARARSRKRVTEHERLKKRRRRGRGRF